jgi:hypothetical protein
LHEKFLHPHAPKEKILNADITGTKNGAGIDTATFIIQ